MLPHSSSSSGDSLQNPIEISLVKFYRIPQIKDRNLSPPWPGTGNRNLKPSPKILVTQPHCKFFVWVDDHIVRVRGVEPTRALGDSKPNDVEEHSRLENLIADVEEIIVNLEKILKKKSREAELKKKNREAAVREKEASSTKSND
ncbi:hypothetical protein HN51_071528 [Arachis hypogaea]